MNIDNFPVRIADSSEFPQLAALHRRTALRAYQDIFPADAPKPTSEEVGALWQLPLAQGRRVKAFVIGEPGSVVAVALAEYDCHDKTNGHLSKLYVDTECWTSGFGSQVHDAALQWLCGQGCQQARLWVLAGNALSRRWYERRGWQATNEQAPAWPGTDVIEIKYRRVL